MGWPPKIFKEKVKVIHTPTDQVLVKSAFNTPITAAANNGATINALGYGRALAIFDSAPSGAGTTSDCKLQEGAASDASDMADVTSGVFVQNTTVAGHVVKTMNIDLSKRKQYLRLVHTGAGGSAAGQAVGTLVLFNGESRPPTQDVTAVSI